MDSPQVANLAAAALLVAAAGCLLRLFFLRLVTIYPAISTFLVFQSVPVIGSKVIDPSTSSYAYIYPALIALEWLIYAWVIRELYEAVFKRFPGIAFVGHFSIYVAVGATVLVSGFSLASAWHILGSPKTGIYLVEFTAQCLSFGFAVLLIFITYVVSLYPLHLHRNVVVNSLIFSLMLLGESSGLILDQITRRNYTTVLNLATSLYATLCMAIWLLLVAREGRPQVLLLRRSNPAKEVRLISQLTRLNDILVHTARK